jgi:hypothetical protein
VDGLGGARWEMAGFGWLEWLEMGDLGPWEKVETPKGKGRKGKGEGERVCESSRSNGSIANCQFESDVREVFESDVRVRRGFEGGLVDDFSPLSSSKQQCTEYGIAQIDGKRLFCSVRV